jgi:hypothetical protein
MPFKSVAICWDVVLIINEVHGRTNLTRDGQELILEVQKIKGSKNLN